MNIPDEKPGIQIPGPSDSTTPPGDGSDPDGSGTSSPTTTPPTDGSTEGAPAPTQERDGNVHFVGLSWIRIRFNHSAEGPTLRMKTVRHLFFRFLHNALGPGCGGRSPGPRPIDGDSFLHSLQSQGI